MPDDVFEFRVGNLLDADEPHIAHGVNLQGAMGAGIAGQIAERWPVVRSEYREDVRFHRLQLGGAVPVNVGRQLPFRVVWNLGTQWRPGREARLDFITPAFHNLAAQLLARAVDRVAIPRIGCGIGGLRWTDVEDRIRYSVESVHPDLTVAVYDLVTAE